MIVALSLPAQAEKVMNADIAVVGSGAAGTAAGLQAALGGAKVIMLEKQKVTGGTSNFAEGPFGVETKPQAGVGISVTRDYAYKYMIDYSHWMANPRLIRAFVTSLPRPSIGLWPRASNLNSSAQQTPADP